MRCSAYHMGGRLVTLRHGAEVWSPHPVNQMSAFAHLLPLLDPACTTCVVLAPVSLILHMTCYAWQRVLSMLSLCAAS